ncbi:MAG TPA: right-handed parallel beta-helix repeat-containing protein [Pyrinomonadaceae bacterium]|nr:right-handed parallel beta-helix repeat-containing protein [Pyrinomonadaceae bacterium]
MTKLYSVFKGLLVLSFTLACVSIVQAQASRTWVSGVGNDADPCSRTAPCKTYSGALIKTAAGGEISTLDPGGYGSVTITKSISIVGTHGAGYGSILASNTNGIIVNDAQSGLPNTIVVTLRNLSINGAPTSLPGTNGIRFLSGLSLNVEDCQIFGFRAGTGHGIDVSLTAGNNQQVMVKDTQIFNNLGSGIRATHSGAGAVVRVTLDNVRSERNGNGALFQTGTAGILVDSRFSYNVSHGVSVTNAVASANIDNCRITQNTLDGVNATAGVVRLSDSYIIGNLGSGVNSPAGQVQTFGNNKIKGNVTDVTGALTPIAPPAFQ